MNGDDHNGDEEQTAANLPSSLLSHYLYLHAEGPVGNELLRECLRTEEEVDAMRRRLERMKRMRLSEWQSMEDRGVVEAVFGLRDDPVVSNLFQSPINIERVDVEGENPPLMFSDSWYQVPHGVGFTKLHGNVQVRFSPPAIVTGGALGKGVYTLDHLQFHWPGEHTIANHRYDLEAHYVLRAPNNWTAVLAVLYKKGSEDEHLSSFLREIVQAGENQHRKDIKCPLWKMLPRRLTPYFTYMGSLTTPPYSGLVRWIVIQEPRRVSEDQIIMFKRIRIADGAPTETNYRAVQPTNGRRVVVRM